MIEPDAKTRKARRWIGYSAAGLLIGILLSATGNAEAGSWATVLSMIGMTIGLHSFGRSGPDRPSASVS